MPSLQRRTCKIRCATWLHSERKVRERGILLWILCILILRICYGLVFIISRTLASNFRIETRLNGKHCTGTQVFPPEGEVFEAFRLCPFDKVKVLIIGESIRRHHHHFATRTFPLQYSYRPQSCDSILDSLYALCAF